MKFPTMTSAKMSYPLRIGLAAGVALAALAEPATAVPTAQPVPAFEDYCRQVKIQAAVATCMDAAKQFQAGQIGLSFTLIRKAVAAAPNDGNLHLLTGIILTVESAVGPAERELRLARHYGASDVAVLPPLFRTMVLRHEEGQLLNEFPEPAKDATGEAAARILHGRALALRSLGRLDEAAAALDRSLKIAPRPISLRDRANIALQQNDPALANRLVDQALVLDPQSETALTSKLKLLDRAGDTAKMLTFSDRILQLYPHNIDSRAIRFNLFLKLNQDDRAKAELDRISTYLPGSPLARYYQAVFLSHCKDNNGAYQLIQALPPEFPKNHPELALQSAQIAIDHGSDDLGANILGAALSTEPNMLEVRLRLVDLRLSQNTPQAALLLLSPVKDLPDPRVKKLLAECQKKIAKDRAF